MTAREGAGGPQAPGAVGPAEEGAAGPTGEDGASDGALLVLTTTELQVLEVAHLSGLVEHQPQVEGPGGDVAEAAWVEAITSLSARGLIGADGRLEEGTAAGQLAQTVLDVRLGADALVVVERLLQVDDPGPRRRSERQAGSGPRRDVRVLHLLPVGAVVEDVHAEGLHGFDLVLEPDDLVQAVTDVLVPPDAVAGPEEDGRPQVVEIDPGRADLVAAMLGYPTVLAELTLATAEARTQGHLVALGAGGCWAATRRPGPLRFVAVPAGWVACTVGEWVAGVVTGAPG